MAALEQQYMTILKKVLAEQQGSVASFMAELMETHFALAADPALPNLRNINTAADAYPRKRLLDYLSSRAPQR